MENELKDGTAPTARAAAPDDFAEAIVERRRRRISLVWIVPLIAAGIGIWLVIVGMRDKGPRVTVTFETAEGLEAGKTKVKYRDVDIGLLNNLAITDDRRHVIATIDFAKTASPYLTETTKFWVVRPRFDTSGISGLGTLLSGPYIEIEPGEAGKKVDHYSALEEPPVVRTDAPGRKFLLRTDSAESLDARTPIYFRGIRVGQVLGYQLDSDRTTVDFHVFVKAPYDRLVAEASHFWKSGGIEASAGTDGFKVKIGSLASLLSGGIEFDASPDAAAEPAQEDQTFPLFASKEAIGESTITEKIPYVMYFDGSVRGLTVGAPVEFRGLRIGTVSGIRPEVDFTTRTIRIAVTANMEPDRLRGTSRVTGEERRNTMLPALVERGLRAQLQVASLLTGQKFIDLNFQPDEPDRTVDFSGPVPEMPTVPPAFDEIADSVEQILKRFETLPIDQLAADLQTAIVTLNDTLQETKGLVRTTNRNMDPMVRDLRGAAVAARQALEEAQRTTASLDNSIGESSEVRTRLALMLRELTSSARSIRELADSLERNPESLIKGKSAAARQ
jgi:paraquat-inducible protein B